MGKEWGVHFSHNFVQSHCILHLLPSLLRVLITFNQQWQMLKQQGPCKRREMIISQCSVSPNLPSPHANSEVVFTRLRTHHLKTQYRKLYSSAFSKNSRAQNKKILRSPYNKGNNRRGRGKLQMLELTSLYVLCYIFAFVDRSAGTCCGVNSELSQLSQN